MSNTYRYLIYSRNDRDYTAELTQEYILYGNQCIHKPTWYMCQSDNYGSVSEGGDFLLKCVDYCGNTLFTTSYRQLKDNITALNGREKIKQIYNILEEMKYLHIYENTLCKMSKTTI